MFIKEVHLKRNGFSSKLIHFVFPWAPVFNNYCPHFWLAILAGILSPFATVIRAFVGIGRFIGYCWCKYEDYEQDRFEAKIRSLSKEDYEKFLYYTYNDWTIPLPICIRRQYKKLQRSYKTSCKNFRDIRTDVQPHEYSLRMMDWAKELKRQDAARSKANELKKKQLEERAAKRKAIIPIIMNIAKVLIVVIGMPIVLYLGYHIFMFLGWCTYWIIHANWIVIMQTIFIIFLIVASIAILVEVILLLARIPFNKISKPSWMCVTWQKIKYISHPVCVEIVSYCKIFGHGIAAAFSFFWIMFMAWKSKNCPAIIWKD
jgi:hypothetical protein